MDSPPVNSAANECTGPTAIADLTIAMARLMEGEDPETTKLRYGSQLVEEAISELENRI
ncbi:MAG: hypothetical protein JOZ08_03835 [Verrucomicrobia bacterium]|nr:hypothetical protein [Verrucomicrobiota bacterium]